MKSTRLWFVTAALCVANTPTLRSQAAVSDSVLRRIWAEGTQRSQLYPLARTLLDSIGPRLTGSVEQRAANAWALEQYRRWQIPARAEQYGRWIAWRRGTLHLDLLAPRVRSLEGMLFAYSPGTNGPVVGPVVARPAAKSAAEFDAWLAQVRGKFVLEWYGEPSCRPDQDWATFGKPETVDRFQNERRVARDSFYTAVRANSPRGEDFTRRLENAGALGLISGLLQPGRWVEGWGVSKLGSADAQSMIELGVSCEDYGLLFRLAQWNQGPILRVNSDAAFEGEVGVANVIAELRGTAKPNEYVVLSAHLDSWDAASGATDNGANTVAIMEAMRILKSVYPRPRRSIIAAHWNGEEQGLNGSSAFGTDHPEIISGLQVLLNADNGVGRATRISMQGFTGAGGFFRRWLARVPPELSREVQLVDPGTVVGGSDENSFTCRGAPAFSLEGVPWSYTTYTWHTNRDTFDKLVFDDLRSNATLLAMLAYLAAEEPERMPRERLSTLTIPTCPNPARDWAHRRR